MSEQRGTPSPSDQPTVAECAELTPERAEALAARHRRLQLALSDVLGYAAPKQWTTMHVDASVSFGTLDERRVEALLRALEGLGFGQPMRTHRSTLLGQLALSLDLASAPSGHLTVGVA